MQSRPSAFIFDTTFNFGTDSLLVVKPESMGAPFPPTPGNFLLLDGTDFLLLDNTNLLLL